MGVSKFNPLQLHAAKTLIVQSLFERYRDEVAVNMAGRNEFGTVNRIIRDSAFMPLLVSQISPHDIQLWRDARVKQVQPQSVNREFNTISAVFTKAMKEWRAPLTQNPCHLVSQFAGADRYRNKRWHQKDVDHFLKSENWSEQHVPKVGRDYVAWALLLAIETAMREGELCALLVSDFYPKEKRVHLSRTKNGDERDVPLSIKAIKYFKHLCKGKKPEEKIFPIVANTLCEYALEARRKCHLEHLTFHDTRHEAATRISKKLVNVLELSAQTGHKSLRSLKRYYNPTAAEIAAKLG
jgi:integrase